MEFADRYYEALTKKLRGLEAEIEAEMQRPWPDTMALQRLKRSKLTIKDELVCREGLMRSIEAAEHEAAARFGGRAS